MTHQDYQYQGRYADTLKTYALHKKSGDTVRTDAPKDNQGDGRHFSPTDLLATSLGSCMLTIMGIKARAAGLEMDGAEFHVKKVMSSELPRRVIEIHVDIYMPDHDYSDHDKKMLTSAARHCPVANSLHPDIDQHLTLHWADAP